MASIKDDVAAVEENSGNDSVKSSDENSGSERTPEVEVEEEYVEVIDNAEESGATGGEEFKDWAEARPDMFSSPDIGETGEDVEEEATTPKSKKQWVYLGGGQVFQKKLRKLFVEKPMSLRRCRQDMLRAKNSHRVAVYPVTPETMMDPTLNQIFDCCNQIHVLYHHITSQKDSKSALQGLLQLWFKRTSDIKRHFGYLQRVAGPHTKVYHPTMSSEKFSEYQEGWKEKFEGSQLTTMIAPYLPENITEDELWDLFPTAEEIAIVEDSTPQLDCFRFAYILFPHKEATYSSITLANQQGPRHGFRSLHLVPMRLLMKEESLLQSDSKGKVTKADGADKDKKDASPKKSKKTKAVVSTKNKKFQQNFTRPTSAPPANQRKYLKPKYGEEDISALVNLLSALGPEAPGVIDTIAVALEGQQQTAQMPNYGRQESYNQGQIHQGNMPMGRGRGRGLGQYPNPQMMSNQSRPPQQKRQTGGQSQSYGQSHQQQQQSQGRSANQQGQSQKNKQNKSKNHNNNKQQTNQNRNRSGQQNMQQNQQTYQKMVGAAGRGRGRGLLRFPDESFGNQMQSRNPFMGGRGKRPHFDQQMWSPSQEYSSPAMHGYEDWDGYGQSYPSYSQGDGTGYDFRRSYGGQPGNFNFGASEEMRGNHQRHMNFTGKPYGGTGYQ